jgi:hypothetical protein
VQVNGSLNHDNMCTRYRDVLKYHKFSSLFRGLNFKVANGLLYSFIMVLVDKGPNIFW